MLRKEEGKHGRINRAIPYTVTSRMEEGLDHAGLYRLG